MKNLPIDPETQQKLFQLVHADPCQAFALCVGMPEYFAGCWEEFVRKYCSFHSEKHIIYHYYEFICDMASASGKIGIVSNINCVELYIDGQKYITSLIRKNTPYDREIRRIVKDFGQYVLQYYTPTTKTENTDTTTEPTETTTEKPTA
jgi:hypothetical protein